MTNKKLLREINEWEKENIIDSYAADRLRERYSNGGKVTLVTIFSILSSVLVGAGVILLFATNWNNMPLAVKTVISFLPLIAGQAAAMFILVKKYENTVVRECVSILYTAGIFATLAMIGNSFDLVSEIENYILICSVLTLPVIFIMSAVSPLPVYYAGVLFYSFKAISDHDTKAFVFFTLLMILGGLFILRVKKEEKPDQRRIAFVEWLNVAASLPFVIKAIDFANLDGNITYLAYFVFLVSLHPKDSKSLSPFSFFGTLGTSFILAIFASGHSWFEMESDYDLIVLIVIYLASFIATFARKADKLKVTALISSCVCIVLFALIWFNILSESILLPILANIGLIVFAIALIISGTEDFDAFTTNVGLIDIGAVVIMRFFDWDLDIFAKGIAFIAAGVVLFIFNRRLSKKKKGIQDNKEEVTQ